MKVFRAPYFMLALALLGLAVAYYATSRCNLVPNAVSKSRGKSLTLNLLTVC